MLTPDRLQRAKFQPKLIEEAVRTALRDAVAWRIGGGAAPRSEAFAAAALAAARPGLDSVNADAAERSSTLAAVQRAARRFTSSPLCRRLMHVAGARFVRLPHHALGADVIVRDRNRHLHAIVLSLRSDPLEIGQIASRIATATALPAGDRLSPLTVHVFSLATGRRRTFERDATAGGHTAPDTRVA